MQTLYLGKILKNQNEILVFTDGKYYLPVHEFNRDITSFTDYLQWAPSGKHLSHVQLSSPLENSVFINLIEGQNIFATGCTFEWSDEKLKNLSENDPYKKIYYSERSMFFYKGNKKNLPPYRGNIGIRSDSATTIPEAELVAVFNHTGTIIGYTLGNDVTAVDIEKQNPLYQMQAKFYKNSISILPLIRLTQKFPDTLMKCKVFRNDECISETQYPTNNFVRNIEQIINQLMKLGLTQDGGFLLLGCGSSYPKDKGLIPGDVVTIESKFFPMKLQNSCELI